MTTLRELFEQKTLADLEAAQTTLDFIYPGGLSSWGYYDNLAYGYNLPRAATYEAWRKFGRQVVSGSSAFERNGKTFYGIEDTHTLGRERVLGKLNIAGTTTGRISSKEPLTVSESIGKSEQKVSAQQPVEPKRAPLPGWGQRTPFDAFKGFATVSCSAVPNQDRTGHALQRYTNGDGPLGKM